MIARTKLSLLSFFYMVCHLESFPSKGRIILATFKILEATITWCFDWEFLLVFIEGSGFARFIYDGGHASVCAGFSGSRGSRGSLRGSRSNGQLYFSGYEWNDRVKLSAELASGRLLGCFTRLRAFRLNWTI